MVALTIVGVLLFAGGVPPAENAGEAASNTLRCDLITEASPSAQPATNGLKAAADALPAPVSNPRTSNADAIALTSDDPAPSADIVVTARKRDPADPLEKVNLKSFKMTNDVDAAITAPLARGYERAVPRPMRAGVHNVLGNLHEPVVFVNFVLQHKIGKAAETLARFGLNSTIGIAGLLDVAKRKPFDLPQRPNGFADTFGFYGVKPGAFLFLPLIGPTTVRDMAGNLLDRLVLPLAVAKPFASPAWAVPAGLLHTLDRRDAFDEELSRQRASVDPYTAARSYYLLRRQKEINALHSKTSARGRNRNIGGDAHSP